MKRRRYSQKAVTGLRVASAAGLRAAVELRGFACHDLADELCALIERAYTVHSVAVLRLREADTVPVGGECRG